MTTRWAVLGASRFAEDQIAPAIAATPGATIAAVWSRNPDRAAELAAPYNAAAYRTVDALLVSGCPDMAYVSTTAAGNAQLVRQLLEAGISTLCEKPVSPSGAEAADLAAMAVELGVPVWVNHHLRLNDRVQALQAALGAGQLGELATVTVINHQLLPMPAGWRLDDPVSGGVMRDLTVHDLDLVAFLLGRPADLVSAAVLERQGAVETHTRLQGRVGRVRIELDDRWITEPGGRASSSVTVTGTLGTAVLQPAVTATGSNLVFVVDGATTRTEQGNNAYQDLPAHVMAASPALATLPEAAAALLTLDRAYALI